MHFNNNHYKIKCLDCHTVFSDDDPFLLNCTGTHRDCLLRATYKNKYFSTENSLPGLFRYAQWLPVKRILKNAPQPILYKSKGLASHLGLENLFILFNGYWPEKNASIETCSFKELEAYSVCARTPENFSDVLVMSSVGNTAKGFIKACSENDIPAIVVIPISVLKNVWVPQPVNPLIKIVVLDGKSDYEDAMHVSLKIAKNDGFIRVGGSRNIAKRDGLGTCLLAAVEKLGRMPHHYFQAVGSGAGAIGVWEMSKRLREDGRFGHNKVKLHLSQSQEFQLMVDAWQNQEPKLPKVDLKHAKRKRIRKMRAPILGNLHPVYSVKGGIFDALKDTSGYMYKTSPEEAEKSGFLFENNEGADVGTAAEVAIASLFQAVESKHIRKDDIVVLNITDGGPKKMKRKKKIYQCQPDLLVDFEMIEDEEVGSYILDHLYGKDSHETGYNTYRETITTHT
jgi:cysteate synthase